MISIEYHKYSLLQTITHTNNQAYFNGNSNNSKGEMTVSSQMRFLWWVFPFELGLWILFQQLHAAFIRIYFIIVV